MTNTPAISAVTASELAVTTRIYFEGLFSTFQVFDRLETRHPDAAPFVMVNYPLTSDLQGVTTTAESVRAYILAQWDNRHAASIEGLPSREILEKALNDPMFIEFVRLNQEPLGMETFTRGLPAPMTSGYLSAISFAATDAANAVKTAPGGNVQVNLADYAVQLSAPGAASSVTLPGQAARSSITIGEYLLGRGLPPQELQALQQIRVQGLAPDAATPQFNMVHVPSAERAPDAVAAAEQEPAPAAIAAAEPMVPPGAPSDSTTVLAALPAPTRDPAPAAAPLTTSPAAAPAPAAAQPPVTPPPAPVARTPQRSGAAATRTSTTPTATPADPKIKELQQLLDANGFYGSYRGRPSGNRFDQSPKATGRMDRDTVRAVELVSTEARSRGVENLDTSSIDTLIALMRAQSADTFNAAQMGNRSTVPPHNIPRAASLNPANDNPANGNRGQARRSAFAQAGAASIGG